MWIAKSKIPQGIASLNGIQIINFIVSNITVNKKGLSRHYQNADRNSLRYCLGTSYQLNERKRLHLYKVPLKTDNKCVDIYSTVVTIYLLFLNIK